MEVLAGRYRLTERLGEGGGGTVWRAHDELLRREVAIKQLRVPPDLDDRRLAEFLGRAVDEARAAGRLSHPSIVTIHDVVGHAGQPWIVMDLVPGHSLDRIVREHGPLPSERVAEIGLAVLDALEAAHARGILHRDVKPANVLIGPDGRALLTDFGIAAPMGEGGASWRSSAGSPAYMAPERFREEPDGPASDLWSLGATLYTAAEGETPFHRPTAAALVAAVLLHEPPPMTRASRVLAWIVLALLDKDPVRRPPPEVVRQALRAAAAPPVPAPASRPARSWRLAVVAALVIVAGLAAGLGAWLLTSGRDEGGGRFTAVPYACRSLTDTQIRDLLGAAPRPEPSGGQGSEGGGGARQGGGGGGGAGGCAWTERVSGHAGTITVGFRLPGDGSGEAAAARELASERAARGAAARDRPGIADEAFACDTADPGAGTTGATVWFRLSNLVVEVAYRRTGDPSVTQADRSTAERAAELVGIGLG
ncbi:serine/threonine protein kinase [Microbispora sp. NBC_01189]|uniref:serine/threonine-protein kinase n=1 Tax=Microbispora sp. NBC_01189 TaxID=2903583 RepID=UPI002E118AEC|nr:serine/threonine protein kinase [Microbispora sp. NBC_01189]